MTGKRSTEVAPRVASWAVPCILLGKPADWYETDQSIMTAALGWPSPAQMTRRPLRIASPPLAAPRSRNRTWLNWLRNTLPVCMWTTPPLLREWAACGPPSTTPLRPRERRCQRTKWVASWPGSSPSLRPLACGSTARRLSWPSSTATTGASWTPPSTSTTPPLPLLLTSDS